MFVYTGRAALRCHAALHGTARRRNTTQRISCERTLGLVWIVRYRDEGRCWKCRSRNVDRKTQARGYYACHNAYYAICCFRLCRSFAAHGRLQSTLQVPYVHEIEYVSITTRHAILYNLAWCFSTPWISNWLCVIFLLHDVIFLKLLLQCILKLLFPLICVIFLLRDCLKNALTV